MRATRIVSAIFPLTVVGAMATERLALLWLGADPASPLVWELWLNAHAACGRIWQYLEPAVGGSMSSQLLVLLLMTAIVVQITRSRRWPIYSFLGNHITLLGAVAFSLVGAQAKVSSLAAGFGSPEDWAMNWVAQVSPAQFLIIIGGIGTCLVCHFTVLTHLRERSLVSLRVRMLQQNL